MYIVSTSDPNEAVIEYPSKLMFQMHSYNAPEHIRVQGVDDGVNDGDGNLNVIFIIRPLYNSPYWDYLEDGEIGSIKNRSVQTIAFSLVQSWYKNG